VTGGGGELGVRRGGVRASSSFPRLDLFRRGTAPLLLLSGSLEAVFFLLPLWAVVLVLFWDLGVLLSDLVPTPLDSSSI
jgi:hypothetical protein